MKNLLIICAAVALVASVSATVSAGEVAGAVPSTTLNSMGFGGVEIMSDQAGLAVRGKGTYAYVWGGSSAMYRGRNGGAYADNYYDAGSRNRYGSSKAVGGSISFAGNKSGYGRHSSTNVNFSGGGAFAYAR
jgi:hypothetical protein